MRPFEVDVQTFRRQMASLKRWNNVVSLRDGARRLRDQTLPSRAVAVTFDDGYQDNFRNAMPILRDLQIPATIFVATGFTGKGTMFNDLVIEAVSQCTSDSIEVPGLDQKILLGNDVEERRRAVARILEQIKYLPLDERQAIAESLAASVGADSGHTPMMTREEIRAVRNQGVEIGAHTVRHPILRELGDDDARNEIYSSKAELEEILNEEVAGFAYPNGRPGRDFEQRDVDLVRRAGFEYAVTTDWAAGQVDSDPFRLPRISFGTRTGLRPQLTLAKLRFGS
jgi:peptidoglycan/xylan/chitin deacetylase (PgdA/CDA1 family)